MSLTLLGSALPIGNLSLRLGSCALETFGTVREILKAAARGWAHPCAPSRISSSAAAAAASPDVPAAPATRETTIVGGLATPTAAAVTAATRFAEGTTVWFWLLH